MMIVACGMPSRSASMTPVWAKPWSSDCRPVSTRSNCSSRTWRRPGPRRPRTRRPAPSGSSSTWIARSAPRASASRMTCVDPGRPGRADDDLAAVLLLQPQRLFEGVGVGLVHLAARVLLADPAPGLVQARLPLAGGNLLDANGYLHVDCAPSRTPAHSTTLAIRLALCRARPSMRFRAPRASQEAGAPGAPSGLGTGQVPSCAFGVREPEPGPLHDDHKRLILSRDGRGRHADRTGDHRHSPASLVPGAARRPAPGAREGAERGAGVPPSIGLGAP